jgi:hypothetical protein
MCPSTTERPPFDELRMSEFSSVAGASQPTQRQGATNQAGPQSSRKCRNHAITLISRTTSSNEVIPCVSAEMAWLRRVTDPSFTATHFCAGPNLGILIDADRSIAWGILHNARSRSPCHTDVVSRPRSARSQTRPANRRGPRISPQPSFCKPTDSGRPIRP